MLYVRVQFAAKLAAMERLLVMAAQAMRQLNDKIVQWLVVEKSLRSNTEALNKLMKYIDQLANDASDAGRE